MGNLGRTLGNLAVFDPKLGRLTCQPQVLHISGSISIEHLFLVPIYLSQPSAGARRRGAEHHSVKWPRIDFNEANEGWIKYV
jgi:hypothetical protein